MSVTGPFKIYHWDTFDNETLLVGRAKTLEAAENYVHDRYGDRVSSEGADKVNIVDAEGNVLRSYQVR